MDSVESLICGYKLIQRGGIHKLGTDAVLLAAWADVRRGAAVLDLGCGAGAAALLVAARHTDARVDGLEIEPGAAALFRENIALNRQEHRMTAYEGDLRAPPGELRGRYSDVVSNPPYFKVGSGALKKTPSARSERAEFDATIGDVCAAASGFLKYSGRLHMVFRPERLADAVCAMRDAGVELKRFRFVQNRAGDAPSLLLIEGRKGGAPGARVLPPLIMRDGDGLTPEFAGIYKESGGG